MFCIKEETVILQCIDL